jgi:flagellar hook assembly protein FlgD
VDLYGSSAAGVADCVAAGREADNRLSLGPGAPNPASSEAAISFTLPAAMPVDLAVYDIAGRRVRTLASGDAAAGEHRVTWDRTDSDGRRVAPGVYLYSLATPEGTRSRKLAVTR